MSIGAKLIAEERQRQIGAEGWTADHDDEHDQDELALAAIHYATPDMGPLRQIAVVEQSAATRKWIWTDDVWPWDCDDDKKGQSTRIRDLVKAGALIAAEIDRLQRLEGGPVERAFTVCSWNEFSKTFKHRKDVQARSHADAILLWAVRMHLLGPLAVHVFAADDVGNWHRFEVTPLGWDPPNWNTPGSVQRIDVKLRGIDFMDPSTAPLEPAEEQSNG